VLTDEEHDAFTLQAIKAANVYRKVNDTTKQAHTKPFYVFLGFHSWADEMIDIADAPSGLEPGSSHYSPIGIFNLLLADYWKGNNNQEAYKKSANYLLSILTPSTRAGWGREYYGLNADGKENHAATFIYSTLVLLLKLLDDNTLKGQIKWVVNQHIHFLRQNNKTLWLFTPLMVSAGWDNIDMEEPTLSSSALSGRAMPSKSVAPEVYLRNYFNKTVFQKQIVALRSGWGNKSLTCLVNLNPFNNKGDRGCSGEVSAVSCGDKPIVNGYLTYFVTSPSQVSISDNGPQYNANLGEFTDNNNQAIARIHSGGWSREFTLDKSEKTLTIIDRGSNNTYWHFVNHSDWELVDNKTIITGGVKITFSSPIVSITKQNVGNRGFFYSEEIFVTLSGSGDKATLFEVL